MTIDLKRACLIYRFCRCHTDWKNLTIFLFNEQEGDFALAKSNPCDNNGGVGRSPEANLPSFVRYASKTRGNESGILRGGSPLGEGVA